MDKANPTSGNNNNNTLINSTDSSQWPGLPPGWTSPVSLSFQFHRSHGKHRYPIGFLMSCQLSNQNLSKKCPFSNHVSTDVG